MENDFKINVYFTEDGEELEQILSNFLIRNIEQNPSNVWNTQYNLKNFFEVAILWKVMLQ